MNQVMVRRFTEDGVRESLKSIGMLLSPKTEQFLDTTILGLLEGSTREKPVSNSSMIDKITELVPTYGQAKDRDGRLLAHDCDRWGRPQVIAYTLMKLEDQGLLETVPAGTDYEGQRLSHYLIQPTSL